MVINKVVQEAVFLLLQINVIKEPKSDVYIN